MRATSLVSLAVSAAFIPWCDELGTEGRGTGSAVEPQVVRPPLRVVPTPGYEPAPDMNLARGITHRLRVAAGGCGVIRSRVRPEPHGLQWDVTDAQGFTVLELNALGETHFRPFSGGRFRVVLQAWDGEKYVRVSNRVTLTC